MAGRKRTLDSYDDEEKRTEGEEAEATEDEEEDEEGDEEAEAEAEGEEEAGEEAPVVAADDDEEEPEIIKPKKKKKEPKPKAPAKSRSRAAKHVRLKVVWGVFDNANKQIESFPFNKEDDAKALATKLATDKKQTFFVQKVKKPFEE